MNKENRRNILFLITYTVILILIINNLSTILSAIGYGFQLLTPLWIGAVIAFIFDRPYEFVRQFLQSHVHWKESVTKGLSITIVYLLTFGFLVMILVLVVPQLAANLQMFADNIGYYSDQLQGFLDQITTALNISRIDISSIQQTISTLLASIDLQIDAIASQIIQVTGSIVSTIVTLCMSFILSIYLLFGKKKLFRQIKRVAHCYLPQHCITIFNEIYDSFLSVFTDYVSGQLREALILGSLCFIGMLILRLDYAALISAVVALTALIPILGTYIGGAVGVILLIFISPAKSADLSDLPDRPAAGGRQPHLSAHRRSFDRSAGDVGPACHLHRRRADGHGGHAAGRSARRHALSSDRKGCAPSGARRHCLSLTGFPPS